MKDAQTRRWAGVGLSGKAALSSAPAKHAVLVLLTTYALARNTAEERCFVVTRPLGNHIQNFAPVNASRISLSTTTAILLTKSSAQKYRAT